MIDYTAGSLFIVAAPSGGGKTSLVKQLVTTQQKMAISVSHTTRKKRPGEQEGIDYFFVDKPHFMGMVTRGEFVEHAQVFDQCYGTSALQITDRLEAGIDVVLDIDWQGALQIRRAFADAVSVFVVPPSLDVLQQRLMGRQQDDEATIQRRMQRARDELSHFSEFEYLIVNDEFHQAAAELSAIVTAHRLRMLRQSVRQSKLLSFLLSSSV